MASFLGWSEPSKHAANIQDNFVKQSPPCYDGDSSSKSSKQEGIVLEGREDQISTAEL